MLVMVKAESSAEEVKVVVRECEPEEEERSGAKMQKSIY